MSVNKALLIRLAIEDLMEDSLKSKGQRSYYSMVTNRQDQAIYNPQLEQETTIPTILDPLGERLEGA